MSLVVSSSCLLAVCGIQHVLILLEFQSVMLILDVLNLFEDELTLPDQLECLGALKCFLS